MRFLLMGLASALLLPLAALAAAPDLDAKITYDTRITSRSGVTQTSHYEERFVRRADHVWAERLFPQGAPKPDAHAAVNALGQHDAFNFEVASRHISLDKQRQMQLATIDPLRTTVVNIPPNSWPLVGFSDTWASSGALIEPQGLQSMKKMARASPVKGSEWYETNQGERFVHVLWSPALQVALRIESGTRDGLEWRSTELTPAKSLIPDTKLPWLGLDKLTQHDYEDFSD